MSKSIRARLVLFLTLSVFLFGPASAAAQQASVAGQGNTFAITRDTLKAFYPEIFGNGRYVSFSVGQPVDNDSWGEFFGFQFKVTRFGPGVSWNPTFDPKTGQMRPTPDNTTFLEGSSWIGYHGEILRFLVGGDLAHSQQNEAIRKLVESHPEWSEDQAIRALKEAGARYGPAEKEQFVSALHLDRAEKFLGRLSIKLVEFDGVSPDHVGNFARFTWIVQAIGEFPDGTHQTHGFSFEPFEGKLISLSELPDRSYASENKPAAARP